MKVDCNVTKYFLQEMIRMRTLCKENCSHCLYDMCPKLPHDIKGDIETIQKWSDENPPFLWADKLKEVLPKINEKTEKLIMEQFKPSDIFGEGYKGLDWKNACI